VKLLSVKLTNFRYITEQKFDLTGNVVGLVGPMGSGKSTLLMSLCFAFTGGVPGKTAKQLVRWNEKNGEVVVDFLHKDKPGTLRRGLGTRKKQPTLKWNDESFTGATDVERFLHEELEVDDKAWSSAIFVGQANLTDILFKTASVRREEWQKLCGLGDASKIHEELGRAISTYPPPVDNKALLEFQRGQLSELEVLIRQMEADNSLVNAQLLEQQQTTLNQQLELVTRMGNEHKQLTTILQKRGELEVQLRDVAQKLSGFDPVALQQKLAILKDSLAQYRSVHMSLSMAFNAAQKQKEIAQRRGALEQELLQVGMPMDLADMEQKLHLAMAALQEAKTMFAMLQQVSSAISQVHSDNKCPVCRQQVSGDVSRQCAEMAKTAQTDVAQKTAQVKELQDKLNQAKQKNMRIADLQSKLAGLAQADTGTSTNLEEISEKLCANADTVRNLEAEQKVATDRLQLHANLLSQQTYLNKAYSDMDIDKFVDSLMQLEQTLCISTDDKSISDKRAQIVEQLCSCSTMMKKHNEDQSRLTTERAKLIMLQRQISKGEEEAAAAARFGKNIEFLEEVRRWFHPTVGPAIVINSLLQDLSDAVNKFLRVFDAEYYVAPDMEETCFVYAYVDGRTMSEPLPPVSELSGGQKVQLAIAFRLAVYCMFARKVGFMTLDEPTIWLDESGVQNFCRLLDTLRGMATQMGLQILISTHEQQVKTSVDSLIELN